MTDKEKARAYDEALKAAVVAHKDEDRHLKTTLERIFPELKESEDDRIRKEIIKYLEQTVPHNHRDDVLKSKEWIAWLEKQSEQETLCDKCRKEHPSHSCQDITELGRCALEKQGEKPRYSIGDVLCDKSCTTLNKESQPNFEIVDIRNGMYICDKGSFPIDKQDNYELVAKKIKQKPACSEEDEDYYDAIIAKLEVTQDDAALTDNQMEFLKSLKYRVQPKQEWNEEDDERIRKALIEYFGEQCDMSDWNGVYGYQVVAWLEKQKPIQNINKEDEEVRQYIIRIMEQRDINVPMVQKALDWLEKQNSNVDNANKEYWRGYREGKQEILDKYAELEKQGEQKEYIFKSLPRLLDMIEPTSKAKAYCQKLIDTLVKEGYATDAKIVGEVLKGWNGEDVPMAVMDEKQNELCEKCMNAPLNSKERARILTECLSQSCWYKGY